MKGYGGDRRLRVVCREQSSSGRVRVKGDWQGSRALEGRQQSEDEKGSKAIVGGAQMDDLGSSHRLDNGTLSAPVPPSVQAVMRPHLVVPASPPLAHMLPWQPHAPGKGKRKETHSKRYPWPTGMAEG